MGTCNCAGARLTANLYEEKIAKAEKSTGWYNAKTVDLVTNIKMFSRDFKLNVNALSLA